MFAIAAIIELPRIKTLFALSWSCRAAFSCTNGHKVINGHLLNRLPRSHHAPVPLFPACS